MKRVVAVAVCALLVACAQEAPDVEREIESEPVDQFAPIRTALVSAASRTSAHRSTVCHRRRGTVAEQEASPLLYESRARRSVRRTRPRTRTDGTTGQLPASAPPNTCQASALLATRLSST